MQLNTPQPGIIVIDNFYQDPYAVKQLALDSEYHQPSMMVDRPQNFSGSLSKQNYHPVGLSQYISKVLGKHVNAIAKKEHGYFRYALPEDQPASIVHCDVELDAQGNSRINYSLVIYLSESAPDPEKNGTIFFRHRQLDCSGATLQNSMLTSQDLNNPSAWDIDSVVGFKWNRAVLFDAALFHTAGQGFGSSIEDARCVQVFYFHEVRI